MGQWIWKRIKTEMMIQASYQKNGPVGIVMIGGKKIDNKEVLDKVMKLEESRTSRFGDSCSSCNVDFSSADNE
jgi:hypothetical protein